MQQKISTPKRRTALPATLSPKTRARNKRNDWRKPAASLLALSLCFPASPARASHRSKPPLWFKIILDSVGDAKNAAITAYQKLIGTHSAGTDHVQLETPGNGGYIDPESRTVSLEWWYDNSGLPDKLTLALFAASPGQGPADNPGITWKRYLYEIILPTEIPEDNPAEDPKPFTILAKPQAGGPDIPVQVLPIRTQPPNTAKLYAFTLNLTLPKPTIDPATDAIMDTKGRLWMWGVYETAGEFAEPIPDTPESKAGWFHEPSRAMKDLLAHFEQAWPKKLTDLPSGPDRDDFVTTLAATRAALAKAATEGGAPPLVNDEDCLAVTKALTYRRLDFSQTGALRLAEYIARIADTEPDAAARRLALQAVRQNRKLFQGQASTIPLVVRPRRRALVAGTTDYAHVGIYPQDLLGDNPDPKAQLDRLTSIAQKLTPEQNPPVDKVEKIGKSLRQPGQGRAWAVKALDALRNGTVKQDAKDIAIVAEDIAVGLTEVCEDRRASVALASPPGPERGRPVANQAIIREVLGALATPATPDAAAPPNPLNQLANARIGLLKLRNFLAARGINFDRGTELQMLWERDATATKIETALGTLLAPDTTNTTGNSLDVEAPDDTVLFVYLMGHGKVEESRPLEPYLLGWDNQKIEVLKIAKTIAEKRSGLRNVVFLIDGCNSGTLAETQFRQQLNTLFTFPDRRVNWFLIASAKGNGPEGAFVQALTNLLSEDMGINLEPGQSQEATVTSRQAIPFKRFAEDVRDKTLVLANQDEAAEPSRAAMNATVPFLNKVLKDETTGGSVGGLAIPPNSRRVALRTNAMLGRIFPARPPKSPSSDDAAAKAAAAKATADIKNQAEPLLLQAEDARIRGNFSGAMQSLTTAWNTLNIAPEGKGEETLLSNEPAGDPVQTATLDPLRLRVADAAGRLNLETGEFQTARFWFLREELPAKRLGAVWSAFASARRNEAIADANLTGDPQGIASPPIPDGRNALESLHKENFQNKRSQSVKTPNFSAVPGTPVPIAPRSGVTDTAVFAAREAVASYELFFKALPNPRGQSQSGTGTVPGDALISPEWAARAKLGYARMQRLLGNSGLAQDRLADAEIDALHITDDRGGDIPILIKPLRSEIRLLKADVKLDLLRLGMDDISDREGRGIDQMAESALSDVQPEGNFYYPALHQAAHLTKARAQAARGMSGRKSALDEYLRSMQHADAFADQLILPESANRGSISGNMRSVYLEYIALRWADAKSDDAQNRQREQDTLAAALRLQRSWGGESAARLRTPAARVDAPAADVIRVLLATPSQAALVYVGADDRTHLWLCQPETSGSGGVQVAYSAVPYGLPYLRDRMESSDASALQTISQILVPWRIQVSLNGIPETRKHPISVYWDSAFPAFQFDAIVTPSAGKYPAGTFQMIPAQSLKK